MIEVDIEHKTIDSNVVTSSGLSESSRADYDFMVIPIDSFSSELPELLIMIKQMVFSAASFSGSLEFVTESNIPPSAGLDVCSLGIPDISFSHL